jgi:hypothetical protein
VKWGLGRGEGLYVKWGLGRGEGLYVKCVLGWGEGLTRLIASALVFVPVASKEILSAATPRKTSSFFIRHTELRLSVVSPGSATITLAR